MYNNCRRLTAAATAAAWVITIIILSSSAVVPKGGTGSPLSVAAFALSSIMPSLPLNTRSRRNNSHLSSNTGAGETRTTTTASSSDAVSTQQTQPLASSILSLGANMLRTLVLDAARCNEEESLDLNGIVWLEHLNLVVGSRALAIYFYIDFLGLTPDANSPSFHCNLGQQQFHLQAETRTGTEAAQKITGSIGLVVPSLQTIRQRLEAAQVVLAGTQFAVLFQDDDVGSTGTMTIRCPWGNIFHLYSAKADDDEQQKQKQQQASIDVVSPQQKMVQLHADPGGAYAASRMTIRGNPGIRYVEIACRPGTVPAIAQFYREMMGCTVTTTSEEEKRNDPRGVVVVAAAAAAVCVGPGVHLVYVENSQLTNDDLQQMQGVHLCIYTAPSFQRLYEKLSDAHLIWTNPRFTHLDCCDTWQEAAASRTLRFKDIINLTTGEKMLELEHETRPSRHGQFLKVPNYEPK